MKPARHQSVEGVVIRLAAYGDADRIVTLFTREDGLFKAIAKNARASRKRFGGALDLFVRVRADVSSGQRSGGRGDALRRLDAAEPLEAHFGIRKSLEALEAASLAAEALSLLTHEHEQLPTLYDDFLLFLGALSREASAHQAGLVRLWFLLRLLEDVGLSPHIDTCVQCGKSADEMEQALFLPEEGGLVCGECTHVSGSAALPAAGVRVFVRISGVKDPAGLAEIQITPEGLARLDRLTVGFLEHRLGKSLRSASGSTSPGGKK